jgi:putative transposase
MGSRPQLSHNAALRLKSPRINVTLGAWHILSAQICNQDALPMAGTYTQLFYHLVFSTKNRHQFINEQIERDLYKYVAGIFRNLDAACIEINGMPDHVHVLALLPPKIAVSDALRDVKANSSRWVHDNRLQLADFAWQDGFAAFTVSKSQVESVRQYIREQKSHHRTSDFKSELIALLDKHGVEYDERYLWGQ